tara:strand:- start:26 stop:346 length:321 start_codon:yes stop_codon:yes gene_type:complete
MGIIKRRIYAYRNFKNVETPSPQSQKKLAVQASTALEREHIMRIGRTGPSNFCGINIRKYMMGITGNLRSGTLADTRYKKIVCRNKRPIGFRYKHTYFLSNHPPPD